jgi:hypothetical protein
MVHRNVQRHTLLHFADLFLLPFRRGRGGFTGPEVRERRASFRSLLGAKSTYLVRIVTYLVRIWYVSGTYSPVNRFRSHNIGAAEIFLDPPVVHRGFYIETRFWAPRRTSFGRVEVPFAST